MLLTHEPMREFGHATSDVWGGHPRTMPMDAYRRGNDVLLHLDLPGVDPDSIELTVEHNVLSVTAHRTFDRSEIDELITAERPQGVFRRQIVLGDGLDTDQLEADYTGGVLVLRVPVHESARPRRIPISVPGDGQQAIGAREHANAMA